MSSGPQVLDPDPVPLTYSISGSSAHSGRYAAENILVDKSADHSSRWSGSSQNNSNQWILLRLDNLAVLKSITFGKFSKPHPCNMKEFKLFVGVNMDHMNEVLHAGLKNDNIPETFPVKHVNQNGIFVPTRYVKIVPISAHGKSFHTSVWHVSMTGVMNEPFVEQVLSKYDEYRETAVLRHVLKHLRQRRLLTPFASIMSRSGFQLEHPLITKLHESIVLQGNWAQAERYISEISRTSLLDPYLRGAQPHAVWKRLLGTDADGDVPPPRGGHAMCIDPVNDTIYLFGGWDGQKSLDDFWAYDVKEDKWRVLNHSTSQDQNAPGARSCHKMVFDTKTGCIYVLGRLNDSDSAQATNSGTGQHPSNDSTASFCSEFYRYHTRGVDSGKWDYLAFNTEVSGGPPLIFDHQMVIDCESQIIYVFGGRVIDGDWASVKYSGLYSYNIRLSKWKMLQHSEDSDVSQTIIPSRFGHSMIFEPSTRTLFIFAGQRDDEYLSDMYVYDIATNTATQLHSNFSDTGGPESCFTQRAVIDPSLREIYVFCGLTRSQKPGAVTTLASESPNWMFTYDRRTGTWTQILPQLPYAFSQDPSEPEREPIEEPLPRYAHQVAYNPNTKTVFMHGGNGGITGPMETSKGTNEGGGAQKEGRLGDLWQMKLARATTDDVVRRAIYKIRQQQFREMCEETSAIKALNFLQTDVSAVVNHSDPAEANSFRSLLTHLLFPTNQSERSSPLSDQPSVGTDDVPQQTHPSTDQYKPEQSEGRRPDGANTVDVNALRGAEDPLEHEMRDKNKDGELTAARFAQRSEVFESFLEFVSESEKQPVGSLLDVLAVGEKNNL